MHVTSPRILSFALLLVTGFGCHLAGPPPSPPASALADDWTLTELNGQPAPTGAGGRRATLRFEADSARAEGFAGCNRFTNSFMVAGDSLRFGAAALTRMACAEGMELERRLLDALTATNRFQITGAELTLFGVSGPVARFSRGTP